MKNLPESKDKVPTFSERYKASSYYQSTLCTNIVDIIRNRGSDGELKISTVLDRLPIYKRILTNVYLFRDLESTEVDIIMLTRRGIYVIESKNYGTSVYGDIHNKHWTAYSKGRKYPFYNPIRQNRGHIKAITHNLAGLHYFCDRIFSIVVFSNRCTYKISGDPYDVYIIPRSQLFDLILALESQTDDIFSVKDVELLYRFFDNYSRQSEEVKQAHINRVKSYQNL